MPYPQDRYIVVRANSKDIVPIRRYLHALAKNEDIKVADMVTGGGLATNAVEDKRIRDAFKIIADTFDKALERAKRAR